MSRKKAETTAQFEDSLVCPIRHLYDIFGGKWKMPIVCMLSSGKPYRYSSIKRKLSDITNVMLAQSLKELETSGIVHREQYNEVPPRVEYSLTEKGNSVLPALTHIAKWAIEDMQNETACGASCDKCQTIS